MLLGETANTPEGQLADIRKVSHYVTMDLGLSLSDLPEPMKAKVEAFGRPCFATTLLVSFSNLFGTVTCGSSNSFSSFDLGALRQQKKGSEKAEPVTKAKAKAKRAKNTADGGPTKRVRGQTK